MLTHETCRTVPHSSVLSHHTKNAPDPTQKASTESYTHSGSQSHSVSRENSTQSTYYTPHAHAHSNQHPLSHQHQHNIYECRISHGNCTQPLPDHGSRERHEYLVFVAEPPLFNVICRFCKNNFTKLDDFQTHFKKGQCLLWHIASVCSHLSDLKWQVTAIRRQDMIILNWAYGPCMRFSRSTYSDSVSSHLI